MLIRGDIEAVNLSTGERFHRVVGNGESRLVSSYDRPLCGIRYRGEGEPCNREHGHYGRHSWASTEPSSPFD